MKIYSKFVDYYDHIVYDHNMVWIRESRDIILNLGDRKNNGLSQELNNKFIKMFNNFYYIPNKDTPIIFGFCGKMYMGIIHYANNKYGSRKIIKTYLDIDKYFTDVKKFNYTNYYSTLNNYLHIRRKGLNDNELFNEWLREFHTFKGIDEIFIELNAPIFAIISYDYKPILHINPCMKDLCLQSSIEPFLAYQEIDNYLNNILINKENKIPKFSDNLIRDLKGFDINSFRKEKR